MPLNKPQQIAVETYIGGEFGHVSTVEEAENVGDTLFLFIMRELSDEEDCDSIDEAIQRLERSQADIQKVLDGLREIS